MIIGDEVSLFKKNDQLLEKNVDISSEFIVDSNLDPHIELKGDGLPQTNVDIERTKESFMEKTLLVSHGVMQHLRL